MEYNAKSISAETIVRVLDSETEQQSKVPAKNTKPAPEKKSMKKTAGKKLSAKKTSDKKSASDKSTAKTTDTSASKKSGGRKKKSENPEATGESQVSTIQNRPVRKP